MIRQKTSHDFAKNKPMGNVAKLAGADGLSFNITANSSLIRKSFKKCNHDKAPQSNPVSAGNVVLQHAERRFDLLQ